MPQDSVAAKLAGAKKTLSDIASKKFPSMPSGNGNASTTPAKPSTPVAGAAVAPKTGVGAELAVKKANIDEYTKAYPNRHKGGPISKSGPYNLKAGEHVLTAAETKQAKKHALMASGMASLMKSGRG